MVTFQFLGVGEIGYYFKMIDRVTKDGLQERCTYKLYGGILTKSLLSSHHLRKFCAELRFAELRGRKLHKVTCSGAV